MRRYTPRVMSPRTLPGLASSLALIASACTSDPAPAATDASRDAATDATLDAPVTADVNLGDSGVMYVFGGDAHFQCY